jgi:hypothetical protein
VGFFGIKLKEERFEEFVHSGKAKNKKIQECGNVAMCQCGDVPTDRRCPGVFSGSQKAYGVSVI